MPLSDSISSVGLDKDILRPRAYAKGVERIGRDFLTGAMDYLGLTYSSLPDRKDCVDFIISYGERIERLELKTNFRPWTYTGTSYEDNFTRRGATIIVGTQHTIARGGIPFIRYYFWRGMRYKAYRQQLANLAIRLGYYLGLFSRSYMIETKRVERTMERSSSERQLPQGHGPSEPLQAEANGRELALDPPRGLGPLRMATEATHVLKHASSRRTIGRNYSSHLTLASYEGLPYPRVVC